MSKNETARRKTATRPAAKAAAQGTVTATAKGEGARTRILDEAVRILIDDGAAGFTLRKLAERLGLRLSHIQYYFVSRESLISQLLDRELANAEARFKRKSTEQDLTDLARFVLAEQRSVGNCRLFWELWALASREEDAHKAMKRFYAGFQNALVPAIKRRSRGLSDAECASRALAIVSLLEGASLFRGGGRRPSLPAGAFDEAVMRAVLLIAGGFRQSQN